MRPIRIAVLLLPLLLAAPAAAAPGELDPSFGSGGTATVPLGATGDPAGTLLLARGSRRLG
jgi:hypothetical protein